MEEKKRIEIARLRSSGKSYSEIARITGLKEGTVKSAISRAPMRLCESCGKPLSGRQGRFCSDGCRYAWWRAHRQCGERTCPSCGRVFAPKDPRRVYCCAECYHKAGGKRDGGSE